MQYKYCVISSNGGQRFRYCKVWQLKISHAMARKITTTVYITENQQAILKELNKRTKIPVAEFIRQGINMVFEHYQDFIPGQLELGELPPGHKAEGTEKANIENKKEILNKFNSVESSTVKPKGVSAV